MDVWCLRTNFWVKSEKEYHSEKFQLQRTSSTLRSLSICKLMLIFINHNH